MLCSVRRLSSRRQKESTLELMPRALSSPDHPHVLLFRKCFISYKVYIACTQGQLLWPFILAGWTGPICLISFEAFNLSCRHTATPRQTTARPTCPKGSISVCLFLVMGRHHSGVARTRPFGICGPPDRRTRNPNELV